MNKEKQYTILFAKSKELNSTEHYFYLTRFSINFITGEKQYTEVNSKETENTSCEPIRSATKERNLYYFNLDEANRIMKKLRKKIRKNKYYTNKLPFIVKKTKVKHYLKGIIK